MNIPAGEVEGESKCCEVLQSSQVVLTRFCRLCFPAHSSWGDHAFSQLAAKKAETGWTHCYASTSSKRTPKNLKFLNNRLRYAIRTPHPIDLCVCRRRVAGSMLPAHLGAASRMQCTEIVGAPLGLVAILGFRASLLSPGGYSIGPEWNFVRVRLHVLDVLIPVWN